MTSPTPTPDAGDLQPAPARSAPTATVGRAAPVVPPVPDAPGYGPWAAEASVPPWPGGGGPSQAPTAYGAERNPLAWWGFGLAFGSLLAAVAGAALALSVLGLVMARRTGRALVPAVVGCAIAGLALAGHAVWSTVRGVEWVASLGQEDAADPLGGLLGGLGGGPDWTDAEYDYIGALADSDTDTYDVYTDPALLDFGYQACDALDDGEGAGAAAQDLDMGRSAAAEVVEVAAQELCPADGSGPSTS